MLGDGKPNNGSSSLFSALKDVVPILSVIVIGIAGLSNGLLAYVLGFSYFRYASISDHMEGVIGVAVALILSALLIMLMRLLWLLLKILWMNLYIVFLDLSRRGIENRIASVTARISRLEQTVEAAAEKKASPKSEGSAAHDLESAQTELAAARIILSAAEKELERITSKIDEIKQNLRTLCAEVKAHDYVNLPGLLNSERPALLLFVLTLGFTILISGFRYAAISSESYAYLSAENIERGCYKVALRLERVSFLLRAHEAPYVGGVECPDGARELLRYVVPTGSIRIFQSPTYIGAPPRQGLLAEKVGEVAAAIKGLTLPNPEPPVIERFEEGLIGIRLTPNHMKSGQVYWRGFQPGAYGLPEELRKTIETGSSPTDPEILEAAPADQEFQGEWYVDGAGRLKEQFENNQAKLTDAAILTLIIDNSSRNRQGDDKDGVIDVQVLGFADGRGSQPLNAGLSHYRAVVVESSLRRIAKKQGYERKFRFFHCYAGSNWDGAAKENLQAYQNPWLRRVELRIGDAIFDDERACRLSIQ